MKGPTQRARFTCLIEDSRFHESYSAEVEIAKKGQVRSSLQPGRIDLADIYITPVSNRLQGVHNHFVLYDIKGNGLYIVRDAYGQEVRRSECTIWDLGHPFAIYVQEYLKSFS